MKPDTFGKTDPTWSTGEGNALKSKGPASAPIHTERKRRRLAEPVYEPATDIVRGWSKQSWFLPAIVLIIVLILVVLGIMYINAIPLGVS